MNTKNIIIEKIELNGAEINEKGEIEDIDSIVFISLVLDLEEEFNIEIPDEYLLMSTFSSIDNITLITVSYTHLTLPTTSRV